MSGSQAIAWLANHLNGHGVGPQEGGTVTTGVITVLFSAGLGDDIAVRFEHLGDVTVTF
ncbi:hypothetical protein [Aestuariivirga sp.]|uniref:hypothetical protein n=1 Tax=Aestuariivirga sp. TaxID=2650926 RepID=UPI0025C40E1B|nr:hypothetical protein [Aestuariivirga sp.]MCA3554045.1 hypothetical protein [Aestuariivirga sp.]